MPNYDFTSLSSYDFEMLVRDLLQKEFSLVFESFKSGRDKGIDLRYSPNKEGTIIVQCKHYANSTFSQLLRHLAQQEKNKVISLSPSRYIIATSIGLTPQNKSEIQQLLSPYCTSTSDIFGRDDLNNLLNRHPEVERQNFKLWLTSQAMLDAIVNSRIVNMSQIEIDHLKRKAKYYVQNRSFSEAMSLLEDTHYCIISGIPGIGKTTLAEMIILYYINEGFDVIVVSNDIEEAYSMYNKERRQLFYYDDFLGQTNLDRKLNKNEDSRLLQFIEAAKQSQNTRFILTTREYILSQAKEIYEKLESSHFDIHKCTIDLSKYTRFDRAKILFNHIYFSSMPQTHKDEIVKGKNYKKIIDHKNYSPRIIEWMTSYIQADDTPPRTYVEVFLENLDKPLRIWQHAFEHQLSIHAQNLLLVLFTMPGPIYGQNLRVAFNKFHRQQAEKDQFSLSKYDFKNAIKELEGNFIVTHKHQNEIVIWFHNPSIQDFLNEHLVQESEMLCGLIDSITYFDQCIKLWGGRSMPLLNLNELPYEDEILSFMEDRIEEPLIRKAVKKIPSTYWAALKRTVRHQEGVLVYGGRLYRPSDPALYNRLTFEERLLFLFEVQKSIPNGGMDHSMEAVICNYITLLEEGHKPSSDLTHLLRIANDADFISHEAKAHLLMTARDSIIRELNSIEDFEKVTFLCFLFPELFTNTELLRMASLFENFASSEADVIADQYDDITTLEEKANRLRDIATTFNTTVEDSIQIINGKIDYIETIQEEARHQSSGWPKEKYEYRNEDNEDNDIDDLFSTLSA